MFPPKAHKPNKIEQIIRYYGYYSNVSRGQRKRANEAGLVPSILQPDEPSKGYLRNWARFTRRWRVYPPIGGLIQKIGACPGLDPGGLTP